MVAFLKHSENVNKQLMKKALIFTEKNHQLDEIVPYLSVVLNFKAPASFSFLKIVNLPLLDS